jgi:hypothetical protein
MEADLKAALLTAYARLLRPLVQILLRNGVSYSEFADTAKRVFVATAARELASNNSEASTARIAIRTGMTQREVSEVLEWPELSTTDSTLAQISALLAGWHTDVSFTGPYGLPLELPIEEASRPSFTALVERYCPDAQPLQLLRKLLAVGAVRQADDGWLTVLTRAYLPDPDAPDSVERIGQTVERLVNTVDFNRQQAGPENRLFERTVLADYGLKEEDLPALTAFVKARGQRLLEEIDNWLSGRERPEPANGDRTVHTGLGIYHYIDEWNQDNKED